MPRWKKRIIVTWTTWGQLLVEEDILAAARRRSLNLNNTAAIFSPIQHPSIFYLDTSETIVHTRPHLRSVQSHQVTPNACLWTVGGARENTSTLAPPSCLLWLTGRLASPPWGFLWCASMSWWRSWRNRPGPPQGVAEQACLRLKEGTKVIGLIPRECCLGSACC